MQRRYGTFWYGPSVEWQSAFGTLSGAFLLGGNKGERAKIGYSKSFEIADFSIEPRVSAEWLSNQFVDYYYGVRPSEALPGRPAYNGSTTVNISLGSTFTYALTKNQTIIMDLSVSHLGKSVVDSPLVGRRYVPQINIGYMYRFK